MQATICMSLLFSIHQYYWGCINLAGGVGGVRFVANQCLCPKCLGAIEKSWIYLLA